MKKIVIASLLLTSLNSFSEPLTKNDHDRMNDFSYIENIQIKTGDKTLFLADIFAYKLKDHTLVLKPYAQNTKEEINQFVKRAAQILTPDTIEYIPYQKTEKFEVAFKYENKPHWMIGQHSK